MFRVELESETGSSVEIVDIEFSSPMKYKLHYCMRGVWKDLPADKITSEIDKVWKITKNSGPRIIIHCNDVEVVNFRLSSSTCSGTRWKKDVAKIRFGLHFKAADYYRKTNTGRQTEFKITIDGNEQSTKSVSKAHEAPEVANI